jgi:hypothetical protein
LSAPNNHRRNLAYTDNYSPGGTAVEPNVSGALATAAGVGQSQDKSLSPDHHTNTADLGAAASASSSEAAAP